MSKRKDISEANKSFKKGLTLLIVVIVMLFLICRCIPFVPPVTFFASIPAISFCFAAVAFGKILVAAYKYLNRNKYSQYEGTIVDFRVTTGGYHGSSYIYFPIIEYTKGEDTVRHTSSAEEDVLKLYEQRTIYEKPNGKAFIVRELRATALLQTTFFVCCFGLFIIFIELFSKMDWSSLQATTMPDFLVAKWLQQILGAYNNIKSFIDTHIYSVDDLGFLISAAFLGLLLSGFPCFAIYNWRLVQKSDKVRRDGVTIKATCKRTAHMKKSCAIVSQYEFEYNNQTKYYMSRGDDETLTLCYDPKTDKVYDENRTNLAIFYIILSLMAFIVFGWFYIKLWVLWL